MGFILSVGNGFGGLRGIRVGVNGGVGGPNDVGLALGTCEGEEEICGMDGIEVGMNGGVGAPNDVGMGLGTCEGEEEIGMDGGCVGLSVGSRVGCGGRVGI